MPTDAALEDEISLRYQMMALDDVRAALDRTSGVKILILDACRNNPVVEVFKRKMSGSSRNVGAFRGLARIDKTQGMVVAYATSADDVAADGTGRNSPYTTALLKRLQEPGLEIEIMFRRIAADVNTATNGRQRPETSVSLLSEYYLNQQDRLAWERIKDSSDPAALNDFVRRFPTSLLTAQAQSRIQVLNRERMEKDLADRQAAQRRQEDEQRLRLAAAEKERAEREAAQRRQEDEQRSRLAAADKERAERETAQRIEREKRTRLAGIEREQQTNAAEEQRRREAADAERLRQAAEAERLRRERETAMKAVVPTPAPVSQEQACKRDADVLTRLRASPVREDVIRFERELACERLRPQLLRLRESLGADERADTLAQAPRSRIVVVEPEGAERLAEERLHESERAQAEAEQRRLARESAPQLASAPPSQEHACKLDAEKLTRLRASQKRDDVIRFERELSCERLRPQVLRLRESLAD